MKAPAPVKTGVIVVNKGVMRAGLYVNPVFGAAQS